MAVHIDSSGKFLQQKTALKSGQLPAALVSTVQADFKDAAIDDAEKVEAGSLVYYQSELERKGAPDTGLVLDAEGEAQTNLPYWD